MKHYTFKVGEKTISLQSATIYAAYLAVESYAIAWGWKGKIKLIR